MSKKYTPLGTIHECICQYFNVDMLIIFDKNTPRSITYMRQIFHYLAYELNNRVVSYRTIGSYFSDVSGNVFDHATVLNSRKRIGNFIDVEENVFNDVNNIKSMIHQ